jgi:hypothetical protein
MSKFNGSEGSSVRLSFVVGRGERIVGSSIMRKCAHAERAYKRETAVGREEDGTSLSSKGRVVRLS